ncbi:MAG: DUF896 domain-containing protein [Clostridia bacterium]|nr:DUF896 domain-containing protein [Clostridia bacterium]
MTKEQIDRINELGRKSRTPEGLTAKEKEEQAELRRLYLEWYRRSIRGEIPKKSDEES